MCLPISNLTLKLGTNLHPHSDTKNGKWSVHLHTEALVTGHTKYCYIQKVFGSLKGGGELLESCESMPFFFAHSKLSLCARPWRLTTPHLQILQVRRDMKTFQRSALWLNVCIPCSRARAEFLGRKIKEKLELDHNMNVFFSVNLCILECWSRTMYCDSCGLW